MRGSTGWWLALGVVIVGVPGCNDVRSDGPASPVARPALSSVTPAEWQRLAARRVFFGHQSVGRNIMDGVADVQLEHADIPLWVVESRRLDAVTAGGIYHARIGRNRYPQEKLDDFVAVMDSAFRGGPGIAVLKLCFADIMPDTDPQALFAAYQLGMAELARRHPSLIRVHVTMPLMVAEGPRGYWKKRLLGRFSERDRNAIMNRYNALLRAAYQGREPFFDLAELESTYPDGRRSFFMRGADTVYTLVPDYTNDGGHLSAGARQVVAEQFLILLAKLPDS